MKVYTNLLSQLLQLVFCLATNNVHLGASVFQLGLQEFANGSILLKIKQTINIYLRKMNQEIKRWRRFHTLSTNSFCLTVFLSFVEGLLGLLDLARLDLSIELDVEASCSALSLLRVRSASKRNLLSCSSSTTGSVSVRVREGRDEREKGHTLEGLHVLLEGTTRFRPSWGVSSAFPSILCLTCSSSMSLRRLASSAFWSCSSISSIWSLISSTSSLRALKLC